MPAPGSVNVVPVHIRSGRRRHLAGLVHPAPLAHPAGLLTLLPGEAPRPLRPRAHLRHRGRRRLPVAAGPGTPCGPVKPLGPVPGSPCRPRLRRKGPAGPSAPGAPERPRSDARALRDMSLVRLAPVLIWAEVISLVETAVAELESTAATTATVVILTSRETPPLVAAGSGDRITCNPES